VAGQALQRRQLCRGRDRDPARELSRGCRADSNWRSTARPANDKNGRGGSTASTVPSGSPRWSSAERSPSTSIAAAQRVDDPHVRGQAAPGRPRASLEVLLRGAGERDRRRSSRGALKGVPGQYTAMPRPAGRPLLHRQGAAAATMPFPLPPPRDRIRVARRHPPRGCGAHDGTDPFEVASSRSRSTGAACAPRSSCPGLNRRSSTPGGVRDEAAAPRRLTPRARGSRAARSSVPARPRRSAWPRSSCRRRRGGESLIVAARAGERASLLDPVRRPWPRLRARGAPLGAIASGSRCWPGSSRSWRSTRSRRRPAPPW